MLNLVRPKSIFFSSLNYNSQNCLSSNIKSNKGIISSKRCITPIEFIKDKNKFYIPTFFDKKTTKKFLASKDIALMEMKLDDEVICIDSKDENDTGIINKMIKSEIKRHKNRSPNKNEEKTKDQKVRKRQTLSPENRSKKNIKKKRKNKEYNSINGFESNLNNKNGSLDINKLIMDDIDDSEYKFYQKNKIAKVETKKTQNRNKFNKSNNSKNNNFNNSEKTYKNKKKTKNKKKEGTVDINKAAKKLMTINDKEISSIYDENFFEDKNESKFFSNLNLSKKNGNNTLTNNNTHKIDINSENHSLISLLSELL